MKSVILIGNGILSLMSAYRIIQNNKNLSITIIGKTSREGCASVTAPAMLNSYAELIKGSLDTDIDRQKFKISRLAGLEWRTLFKDVAVYKTDKPNPLFGTYVLNNATTDELDDTNFNAIETFLQEFNEEYEHVNPSDIPGYNPSSKQRALRALYMKNEGFVNSESVLDYLVDFLKNNGVNFVDDWVLSLKEENKKIIAVETEKHEIYKADKYILAPGANFSKIVNQSNLSIKFQPILYGSGVAVEIEPREVKLTNCVRTPNRGLACGVYSAPRTKNTIFVGASNLVADFPLKNGMLTSVESLLKAAMEQIDKSLYNAQLYDIKVGWRPTSQDTYPMIGKTNISNLIVATGTKRDGFHMSPIISRYVASLLEEKEYEYATLFTSFAPERSLIKNISREQAIQDIVNHSISAMYQHDFEPPKSDMLQEYKQMLVQEANKVHDMVGAKDFGLPPELYNMYKSKYLTIGS